MIQTVNLVCDQLEWSETLTEALLNENIQVINLNIEEYYTLYKREPLAEYAHQFTLFAQNGRLSLSYNEKELSKMTPIAVDFTQGAKSHRLKYGGGTGQVIAKAVGIKPGYRPTILDATAGLAGDAFVLSGLGCNLKLLERHPIVRLLLKNGLQRAYQDPTIGDWLQERLELLEYRSLDHLLSQKEINKPLIECTEVVYLDPMYPHKQKSALVKKEMRCFQQLVGLDHDADDLLEQALLIAKKRVVVKRPNYANYLLNLKPTLSYPMKNNRFDVYVTH